MGKIKIGDSMDENFNRALEEGLDAGPIIYITIKNLERNYFPPQAAKYYKMLKDMVDSNLTFPEGLKIVFEEGITREQIRNYLNNLVNSPDTTPEDIRFTVETTERTKETEIKLEEQKQETQNNGSKLVYINDYPNDRAA